MLHGVNMLAGGHQGAAAMAKVVRRSWRTAACLSRIRGLLFRLEQMIFKGSSLEEVQQEKDTNGEDIQVALLKPAPACCQMAQDLVDTAVAAAKRYQLRTILRSAFCDVDGLIGLRLESQGQAKGQSEEKGGA